MLVPDVNVLVYAQRPESSHHGTSLAWLRSALTGPEPLGVSDHVLSSVVRILTHRRIYTDPTTLSEALQFCEVVRGAPASVRVTPGERHWALFAELCQSGGIRGNLVPDAYLAALAIEKGAVWVTYDRGFARFPGLRWQLPAL